MRSMKKIWDILTTLIPTFFILLFSQNIFSLLCYPIGILLRHGRLSYVISFSITSVLFLLSLLAHEWELFRGDYILNCHRCGLALMDNDELWLSALITPGWVIMGVSLGSTTRDLFTRDDSSVDDTLDTDPPSA